MQKSRNLCKPKDEAMIIMESIVEGVFRSSLPPDKQCEVFENIEAVYLRKININLPKKS